MEIRNVVNEVKNDYPKMEQVSKKKLTKSVPNKWMKMGISSFVMSILMKSKSFAYPTIGDIEIDPASSSNIRRNCCYTSTCKNM